MKKHLIFTALIVLSACTDTEQKGFETTLWYDTPAHAWTEALPIGNSHLGGMVYGGTVNEEIQLNEETFWAGGPGEINSDKALAALPKARKLILDGRAGDVLDYITENFFSPSHGMRYLTLGSLPPFRASGTAKKMHPGTANTPSAQYTDRLRIRY